MNTKMKRHAANALALTMVLFGLAVAQPSTAQPQAEITMSPILAYVSGPNGLDDSLLVAGPDTNPSILRVDPLTVVEEGDFQWVHFPFTTTLYSGGVVTAVEVCYEIDTEAPGTTYIAQTRLTDTTAPPTSRVVLDNPTDRVDTEPGCYTVDGLSIAPDGNLSMALRLAFGSTDDSIKFGMLRYTVRRMP